MKITLNLKRIWKWQKKISKIPEKKRIQRTKTFLVTLFPGTLYGTVSSIPAMQAIEVWSPTVQNKTSYWGREWNSQDAKMTFISTARLDKSSREYKMGRFR
jgi:hypothetical protein